MFQFLAGILLINCWEHFYSGYFKIRSCIFEVIQKSDVPEKDGVCLKTSLLI